MGAVVGTGAAGAPNGANVGATVGVPPRSAGLLLESGMVGDGGSGNGTAGAKGNGAAVVANNGASSSKQQHSDRPNEEECS
jgi:hypothetical protein